jgi:hypothetical protein
MKLVMMIIVCLIEADLEARVDKHFPDEFPIQNHMKQGHYLSALISTLASEYANMMVRDK